MRFFFTLMVIVMTTAGCGNNEPVAKPAKPEASAPAGNEVRILLANHSEEDWNQWRGPLRNGISGEGNILTEWGPQGPPVLWRQNLGAGFSGISVVDNSVYTMYGNAGNDYLVALDAGSGAKRWELKIGEKYRDRMGGDGPRSTPTVIDGRVYVVSAQGKLFAVDAANGKVLWQRDFVAEYGAQIPRWGFSTSVLVYQGKVYAEVGGSGKGFAAFDAQTGEVRWMTQNDQPAYSSPILAVIDEIPQIIFFATSGLVALNPDNGERYWAAPWHTSYDVNAATPIFIAPNQIFISSEYDVGAALYRVNRSTSGKFEAEQIWKNRQMKNKMATSVFLDGYLYGFDGSILKCIDAQTGEMKWRERGFGEGTLMLAGERLVVLSDDGELSIAGASPNGFTPLATAGVLSGRCWTVPTLLNGRLYLRDMNQMVCLDLRVENKS